jgi:hypothetical protein
LTSVHIVLLAARFIYLLILIFLIKHAQNNNTFNKHLTSKLQFSPKFTLNSVADSNYRGKCDVGGFLIFEWTLPTQNERVQRICDTLCAINDFQV